MTIQGGLIPISAINKLSEVKIILLCNNRLAIPAMQELCFFRQLAAVIIPSSNKEFSADVKQLLAGTDIPILLCSRKTLEKQVLDAAKETNALAGFVMTFPYLISANIYGALPRGFFNFHYGPLPGYRGPEPVFAQLKNRESFAAITVHIINEKIDAGPIVAEERIKIDSFDTYGMLQTKLAFLCAKISANLIKALQFSSTIPSRPQDESKARYEQRPGLNDVLIHWQEMEAEEIRSLINACNPWNKGAITLIKDFQVRITEAEVLDEEINENLMPGTIVSLNSKGLLIATKDRKVLKATIVYCPEGFISGQRLVFLGIKEGDCFIS